MRKQTNSVIEPKEPGLQHPVVKEATVSIYPLELVANVAAKLLSGTDYIKAAKAAMTLLDACEKELLEQAHKRVIVYAAEEKRKARYALIERDHNNEFVTKSFKEALKIITGKNREDRAFRQYKRFLAHLIYVSRVTSKDSNVIGVAASTDEDVEDSIKHYKTEGMRHDVALGQREAFETWQKSDTSDIARQKALSKSPREK